MTRTAGARDINPGRNALKPVRELRLPVISRDQNVRAVEDAVKISIAGGTGVLGRATVPALLAAGHSVQLAPGEP